MQKATQDKKSCLLLPELVVLRPSLENACFSNIPLQLSTRKNLRFNKLDQDVTTVAALLNLSKSVQTWSTVGLF